MNNTAVDQILLKSDSLLNYRGFTGRAEFDVDNKIFTLRILFVHDGPYSTFTNARDIEDGFKNLVDEYIEACEVKNIDPYPHWSGSFNVRLDPELHTRCVQAAKDRGISLNRFVKEALEKEIHKSLQKFNG